MGAAACAASLDLSWQATLRAVLEAYGELCPVLTPAPVLGPIAEPQGLRRTGS
jgi:hypothetical protein